MEDLLCKLVEYFGKAHDYVILKKDEKGFYIEYAFCEGAPHDNRCLSWYHSYQPNARKRNGNWDDERLANHKKQLDENIGKIYRLSSFTCGGEEDSESQIERHREIFKEYHPSETFIPENYVCKVGKPAPQCRECRCLHWTYEEPVKCACWYLKEVDPNKIQFSFTTERLQKFIKDNYEQIRNLNNLIK